MQINQVSLLEWITWTPSIFSLKNLVPYDEIEMDDIQGFKEKLPSSAQP